jgi:hypothetical protein
MSEFVKLATTVGDQYLSSLAESQEAFLKAMAPLSEMTAKMPSMPMATPGIAADLPTPQEITEANFAFMNKLLKQQKKFADKLFAASPAA